MARRFGGGRVGDLRRSRAWSDVRIQLTNVETIRSERTFGQILRGLQVYGRAVLDNKAICAGHRDAGWPVSFYSPGVFVLPRRGYFYSGE